LRRRQRQWRPAAPPAHQLRREQLSLLRRAGMVPQEPVERPDSRLVLAEADVGAVAAQRVRRWRRERRAGLARIAEAELARLDRRSLTGERVDAAALDGRLADRVPVAERVEIARLGAEVLDRHDRQAGDTLIVRSGQLHAATPRRFTGAEHAD